MHLREVKNLMAGKTDIKLKTFKKKRKLKEIVSKSLEMSCYIYIVFNPCDTGHYLVLKKE